MCGGLPCFHVNGFGFGENPVRFGAGRIKDGLGVWCWCGGFGLFREDGGDGSGDGASYHGEEDEEEEDRLFHDVVSLVTNLPQLVDVILWI